MIVTSGVSYGINEMLARARYANGEISLGLISLRPPQNTFGQVSETIAISPS